MTDPAIERTLVLIKPDGVRRGLVGEILGRFEKRGLTIVAAKLVQVSRATAEAHYAEHKGKPFYPGLVEFITSAPVVALAIEGRSAISTVRTMVGATDPLKAAPGTIRGDFALSMSSNIIHASDSAASAARELALFFRAADFVPLTRVDSEYV